MIKRILKYLFRISTVYWVLATYFGWMSLEMFYRAATDVPHHEWWGVAEVVLAFSYLFAFIALVKAAQETENREDSARAQKSLNAAALKWVQAYDPRVKPIPNDPVALLRDAAAIKEMA